MIIQKHRSLEIYIARQRKKRPKTCGTTGNAGMAGITQVPAWTPDALVRTTRKRILRKTEASEETQGMQYRFYSLLYKTRTLSELLNYPDVDGSGHDFEFYASSPSGIAFQLTRLSFLSKQDYAVINRIRADYANVIVGYVVPESVLEENTWDYAEVSIDLNQSIRVVWRH